MVVRWKCPICKRLTHTISYIDEHGKARVCVACDHRFFSDLHNDKDKIDRLVKAMLLSQKSKISIGKALNVLRGKYSLQEAKEREKDLDIFIGRRRRPGSFH